MIALIAILFSSSAYAHKGHHHEEQPKLNPTEEQIKASTFSEINAVYLSQVKPIFQKSCFDCHSNQIHYPWYYSIPGVKQLIDSDISESKEHLDFSSDYPFRGHGAPEEDLKAIIDVMKDESMPPLRYKILHPSNKFTAEEKSIVIRWAEESATRLQTPVQDKK